MSFTTIRHIVCLLIEYNATKLFRCELILRPGSIHKCTVEHFLQRNILYLLNSMLNPALRSVFQRSSENRASLLHPEKTFIPSHVINNRLIFVSQFNVTLSCGLHLRDVRTSCVRIFFCLLLVTVIFTRIILNYVYEAICKPTSHTRSVNKVLG